MEFLRNILENSQYSVLSALILGLMTAVSPCPLATNISAIGFISRDFSNRKRVFISGLIYTLGRAISYFLLALILYFGASRIEISRLFQGWGEKLLAPMLIIIGLVMLDVIKINFPGLSGLTERIEKEGKGSYLSILLLGMTFALAFCPYSGVLFFTMLIPMTIVSAGGMLLPVIFAVATGIPVIIFAWLIAFAAGSVGKLYSHIRTFEILFRRVVALLFLGTGLYYLFILIF